LTYFFADLDSYLSEGIPTKEALLHTIEDYRYVFEMLEKKKPINTDRPISFTDRKLD